MYQQPQQKNWWGRNWKWFVPTGCLTLVLICGGFFTGIFFIVFGSLKSSDVYQTAVTRAQNNAEVRAALGTPIEPRFWVSGEIKTSNNLGRANLAIPISGPQGNGTIYVVAHKSGGKWDYSIMACEIAATGARIDLLTDPR
ncbi:MAG TPA: cytochrome c oxidase assembly factor Coa1 family protein [Blastocatellia bacterium]|nr:cytochrome c oxidase assembly factor Coa1 family protein [Blastocatellia bacterium]